MNIKEGLCADDVLLVPKYSEITSRSNVDISVDLGKGIKLKCPIVAANMSNVCGPEMAKAISDLGGLALLHRFMEYEEIVKTFISLVENEPWRKDFIGCSVGVQEKDKVLVKNLISAGCKIICIDIAHAHSKLGLEMTKHVHETYPDVLLIVGNVATYQGYKALSDNGADVVKCGVGSGCFAAGTRILMSNGTCKNIEDISTGDTVINKDGKPVKVKNMIMTGIKKVVSMKHDLSHKETLVTSDHQYWVGDGNTLSKQVWDDGFVKKMDLMSKTSPKQSKYKWKMISDLKQDCLLLPKNIEWELAESFSIPLLKRSGGNGHTSIVNSLDVTLTPSYELGYIFGTFLGDGHAFQACTNHSKSGSVFWYFGLNEENIANKLNDCLEKVFNKKLVIEKTKNILHCRYHYKPLADFLFTFGKKDKKHLPSNLIVNNSKYLEGILDGLIDSDGSCETYGRRRFINTSEQLIELFSFISKILYGAFASACRKNPSTGKLNNCKIENCLDGYVAGINNTANKRLTKNYQISQIRKTEIVEELMPVYDIEVDCETHSFIANYAIVHNSICSTRIETGNGVPQLTALSDIYEQVTQKENLNIYYHLLKCYEPDQPAHFTMKSKIAKLEDEAKHRAKIIADGGTRRAGDGVKYLCFSDALMLGNVLAGTDEAPGETFVIDGVAHKTYAGSSTHKSNHIEGVVGLVPSKGPVKKIVESFLEGIRSGLSYQGVSNLEDLKKNPEFVRISSAGLIESHPHSVKVVK